MEANAVGWVQRLRETQQSGPFRKRWVAQARPNLTYYVPNMRKQDMKTLTGRMRWLAMAGAAVWSLACIDQAAAETQQRLMRVCAAEWNSLKEARQAAGKVYQDFIKECLARHRAATKPQGGS